MAKDYDKDSKKVDKIVKEGIEKHGDGRIPVPKEDKKDPPPKKDK